MSSSSAVPQNHAHVSELLSKLIAIQSMDTRLWLRGEMVRLVDPMIDSLFLGLSSVRPGAQPSKQTNSHSTMSELCQLIEGEKETTNRLVRGQMDRLVNSLFLRLTNKALVNTEVSAFASVQPSPSNHQTVSPNASIAQSTMNNSNEVQITCPPTHPITTSQLIKQECLESSSITIPINVDCSDAPNDDDNHDQCDELDPVPFGTHLPTSLGNLQSVHYNEREEDRFDEVDETDEDEQGDENGGGQGGGDGELLTSGQIDEDEMDVNGCGDDEIYLSEGESSDDEVTKKEKMGDDADAEYTEVEEESEQNRDEGDDKFEMDAIGHGRVSKRFKRIVIQQKEIDANNASEERDVTKETEEKIATECTTNPIQANRVQSNRHLQCSHCHKSFVSRSKLQQHLRVHTGERSFQCDQCNKRFKEKNKLTRHQLIHQNIKRFQCHECDKRFILKHQLNTHLLIHSGERPFDCRHCDKSFTDVSARTKHEQAIHLHVKPYRCKQCGHTSTYRANIIIHIRTVHFGLPPTLKEQRTINIIDERDPRELVEKV